MELKKRCTCAGVRSDWINRHSFSVNESLPGLLFIPQELLADGFGKGKDKLGKPVGSVYYSAPAFKEFKSGGKHAFPEIRSQRSETDRFRPILLASDF